MQRKIISLFLTLWSVVCLFCFTACGATASATVLSSEEKTVIIRIDAAKENATLFNALDNLEKSGAITFAMSGGMIISVNGKANVQESATSGYSWMIYTSNTSLSYQEYGSKTYDNVVCYSAAFGAEQLQIKTGETIILSYDYWSF